MKLVMQDVSFSYGNKVVLSHMNLTLNQGDRIALMGQSGSGKTTLLRLMAGLNQPDSGSISGIPKQGISMVFQENRLLPQLTVLDNLKLIAPEKSTDELTALLAELDLAGEENSRPAQLSGGMKRRVAIARAVAFESPLILLDEPFTGLDEKTCERAAAFLLHHTQQSILVAVIHAAQEASLLHAQIRMIESLY